jgi:hypothetical protein
MTDVGIGFRDFRPAVFEAHGAGLFAQVGVLAAGHLVVVHVRGAGADVGFEGYVAASYAFPVV